MRFGYQNALRTRQFWDEGASLPFYESKLVRNIRMPSFPLIFAFGTAYSLLNLMRTVVSLAKLTTSHVLSIRHENFLYLYHFT